MRPRSVALFPQRKAFLQVQFYRLGRAANTGLLSGEGGPGHIMVSSWRLGPTIVTDLGALTPLQPADISDAPLHSLAMGVARWKM